MATSLSVPSPVMTGRGPPICSPHVPIAKNVDAQRQVPIVREQNATGNETRVELLEDTCESTTRGRH